MEKFICYNEKQEYEGLTMPSENIDEEDLFLSKWNIFDILEDNQIPLVKKKDYLDSYDVQNFVQNVQFQEFCRILEINEKTKNYKVAEFCGKIMKHVDFSKFIEKLYFYLASWEFQ